VGRFSYGFYLKAAVLGGRKFLNHSENTMLKGHGSETHQYSNIRADFSSNVSWVDYSAVILPIISKNILELQRYPDVEYAELVEALAQCYGLSSEHFLVTNGAVAGIYQTAQAFSGARSHLFFPEFAEYESALTMFQHDVTYSPFGKISKLGGVDVADEVKFVMLGNPNNPTGELVLRSEICQFLSERKTTTVVVDESYMEFVEKSESVIEEVARYPNLIVIKSFTKRYSIPGLRLGYIIAQPAMIDRLNRWTQPWSVNALASKVGVEMIRSPEGFPLDWAMHHRETERFYNALKTIPELEILPSASHYFLIKLQRSKAHALKDYLVSEHGLLIRDASNFRGLDDSFFRVATRSSEENNLLISALESYFFKERKETADE